MLQVTAAIALLLSAAACTTLKVSQSVKNSDSMNSAGSENSAGSKRSRDSDVRPQRSSVLCEKGAVPSRHHVVSTNYAVEVTLQTLPSAIADKGITRSLGAVAVPQHVYAGEKMQALHKAVQAVNASIKGDQVEQMLEQVTKAINKLNSAAVLLQPGDLPGKEALTLVANRRVMEIVPDPTQTYYINGRRPLFGSGKADFTVGPDITLSRVIAEAEDKTLEQVLGLLPAKDVARQGA